ncbi:MAG: glycine zipper domain-containing protein [Candidatus Obscuribacterales bacterium]|nr:glycine zipper domain-containing protein [Candidatus Obscuribacterales bacterium]
MRSKIVLVLLAAAALLSGCATPLGQQYGTVGAVGGAIVGGVLGGPRGAVVGGALGAAEGGIIGDQQTYRQGGYYAPPAPRPCYWQRVHVYRDGYYVGDRDICR